MSKPVVNQLCTLAMHYSFAEFGETFLDCWVISFAYFLILGGITVWSLEINDLQINEFLLWERM